MQPDREDQLRHVYMGIAQLISSMSYATRAQVGAIIVVNGNIVSYGWNGMPHGFPNSDLEHTDEHGCLVTNPLGLHAESNALMKLLRNTNGVCVNGGEMYVTFSPCPDCAKLIIQSGIKRVFYSTQYRRREGIEILQQAGIEVIHLDVQESVAASVKKLIDGYIWRAKRFMHKLLVKLN
jgi:dCMP deaminase